MHWSLVHLFRNARAAPAAGILIACLAYADTRTTEPVTVLGEIVVEGEEEPPEFSPTESTTTVGPQRLERRQPDNVFEAVRDVPGVSVNGGPRASGMSFNIRGYSDTEDVRVRLDGVTKQFEKYRFGGTFIDPELLKQIEVERGPRIASGSGALGGTVSATTKDAADLLGPGRRFGLRANLGYATNNNETLHSLTGYGRPTASSDVLANVLLRSSDNYELPDGEEYRYSATDTESGLLKGSVFVREDLRLGASLISFNDSGLQPYDATGGQPGVGGYVIRDVQDRTLSTSLHYTPGGRWLDMRLTAGYGQTALHDTHKPGLSTFADGIGEFDDYYDFDIWNLDLANTSVIGRIGKGITLSVLTGAQYEHNRRDVQRLTDDPALNAPGGTYEDGFDPAQPPGTKRNYAAYVQPRLDLGPLSLVPGLRWDRYEVEAAGGTLDLLEPYDQPSEVAYEYTSVSFGASLQLPQRVTVFYNYAEGFRPPLIDEVFGQGLFGRCNTLNLGASLAPPSAICGDLYDPEESVTQEIGLSYARPGVWNGRGLLNAKATWFWNETDHLLESITVTPAHDIGQPGWEKRRGVEVEATLDTGRVFASAGYSHIRGSTYTCPAAFCAPRFASFGLFLGDFDLYDVPGDTLSLTLGARFLDQRLELSGSVLDVRARDVIESGSTLERGDFTVQEDYTVVNAAASLRVNRYLALRLSGENLANATWYYNNGSYQGAQAPGRSIRLTLSAQY